MKNRTLLLFVVTNIFVLGSIAQEPSSFTDSRDGKTYKSVNIGAQIWMAKNLAYKVKNGCWSYKNNQKYDTIYGCFYTWEVAKKVCPTGWHLPSDSEWKKLAEYLGGEDIAGNKMTSQLLWNSPNYGANNESGFNGFPFGYHNSNGEFILFSFSCDWWSSKENAIPKYHAWAFGRSINSVSEELLYTGYPKNCGLPVRCIKD